VPEFLALGLASGEPKPSGGHEGRAKTWHAAYRRVNNVRKIFAGEIGRLPLRRRGGARSECGLAWRSSVATRCAGTSNQNQNWRHWFAGVSFDSEVRM